MNGDFAYNPRQRLDEVMAVPADVIAVLIGTNDARASLPGYPLHERQIEEIHREGPAEIPYEELTGGHLGTVFQRKVLRRDLDLYSRRAAASC